MVVIINSCVLVLKVVLVMILDTDNNLTNQKYSISDGNLLIEDSIETGLERIIVDRNSFFRSEEIVNYIKNTKKIQIYGSILGFLIVNELLVETIEEIAENGGEVEILMTHPKSCVVKACAKEEQWHGKLPEIVEESLKKVFEIKKDYPKNIRFYLFVGVIHNTIISTDKRLIVSPYNFGKRGWYSPTLIFSKVNPTVIAAFDEQLDEMKKYGKINSGTFTEIRNEEDFKKVFS